MVDNDTLDLSKIDPPIWRIMVNDAVYGPFTIGQMRSFAAENRLVRTSLVAMGDGGAFVPATDHAGLLKVFEGKPNDPVAPAPPEPANHVLIYRAEEDIPDALIDALNAHGTFVEVLAGVFLIHSETSTTTLRDELVEASGNADKLILVNANDSRLAWHGLDQTVSAHIHAVWKTGS